MSRAINQAAKRNRRNRAPSKGRITPSATAAWLRQRGFAAPLAIILGTGFRGFSANVPARRAVSYQDVPGFCALSVPGHAGRLFWGRVAGRPTLVFQGRAHYYEGHTLERVCFPVRVMAELGVRALVLTNAAGGIRRAWKPGALMLLRDHINFLGINPLRGSPPAGCDRFVDLSEVYDPKLRTVMKRAARAAQVPLREGVYLAVSGPSYETPAEIRAFARLGADAVGMSTVPEAIVARQHGIQVVGLSCITNRAAGLSDGALTHAEVLQTAAASSRSATNVLRHFCRLYAEVG